MRKRFGLVPPLLFVLLVSSQAIYAQEATDTPDAGWPVEERCVERSVKPPKEWDYEGTIFIADRVIYSKEIGGFHALQKNIATPYYVAFNNQDIVYDGALSPDGKWFAVPLGQSSGLHVDKSGNLFGSEYYIVNGIHVYSTDPSNRSYLIDWKLNSNNVIRHQIMWLDNERLVYSHDSTLPDQKQFIAVNPFTDERSEWSNIVESLTTTESRVFFENNTPYENGWLIQPKLPDSTLELVYKYHFNKYEIRWLPDLSLFVARMQSSDRSTLRSDNSTLKLALFSQNDGLQSIIAKNVVLPPRVSFDGRYVAFAINPPDDGKDVSEIEIADLQTKTIIRLCYGSNSPTFEWSPFNNQLAVSNERIVSILDFDSWHLYALAKTQGRIVGWRKGW